MSSSASAVTTARYSYPWMFGREYDLLFFFAPVLFGVFYYALSQLSLSGPAAGIWLVLVVNAFGAGPFHQGPTWFFYFDKKHREYFASNPNKKLIFFLGPPLIMVVSILGMVFVPWLMFTITMIWAVQHLVQQNIGILLLYHNWGKGEAVVPKPIEVRSQWAPALFFSSIFIQRIIMQGRTNIGFEIITGLLGLWALFSVAVYIFQLRKLMAQGNSLNMPATIFWLISVLSFLPFALLGNSFDQAFLIPVTIHWFQYIGLNYMLVKYKYVVEPSENLPKANPYLLFFATCVLLLAMGIGLGCLKTSGMFAPSSMAFGVIAGLLIGLANIHYFLDAFIWRFRESYQRQEVLPFLLRPRQKA